MNQKLALSLLGLTLAVVATLAIAPIVSEMAYAFNVGGNHNHQSNGVNGGGGLTPSGQIAQSGGILKK